LYRKSRWPYLKDNNDIMPNIALKTMIDATAQELLVLTTDAETLQEAFILAAKLKGVMTPQAQVSSETSGSLEEF